MNFADNKITDVPHLNIVISDATNVDLILKTVSYVKPQWNIERTKLKLLTDGFTNKLVLCTNTTEAEPEEHLLVRIYGHDTDLLIDRKAEIRNMKLLHNYNLASDIYASFANGLVYEFIPGRTVSAEDVTQPEIYKLVAIELAKMHKVTINKKNAVACLWTKLKQFVDLIPEEFEDKEKQKRYASLNFTKSQLLEEFRQFRESVNDLDMPVVFAHNDLLLGNIIYNRTKNKVSFIDFEYADFNYQPFDIGNHFAEYAGVSNADFSKFPKKEVQLDWIRTYLMEYKGVPNISDYEVQTLYVQANKFVLASHLLWGTWALVQAAHSTIDFDYIKYADQRLTEYFNRKSECLSLKLPKSPQ